MRKSVRFFLKSGRSLTNPGSPETVKIVLRRFSQLAVLTIFGLVATGCATTGSVPQPIEDKSVGTPYRIDADDTVSVTIDTVPSVVLALDEKTHLQSLINQKIDFLRLKNPADGTVKECHVAVLVTKFDKGSAFARAMLAGLGQIHLGADVTVTDSSGSVLQKFSVEKSFSWGGIYGASTRIEDLEPALADGVASGSTHSASSTSAGK
jgi:Domain of unknown function (DUF4410)